MVSKLKIDNFLNQHSNVSLNIQTSLFKRYEDFPRTHELLQNFELDPKRCKYIDFTEIGHKCEFLSYTDLFQDVFHRLYLAHDYDVADAALSNDEQVTPDVLTQRFCVNFPCTHSDVNLRHVVTNQVKPWWF